MAEALFDSPIGPLFAVATAAGLERLEFVSNTNRLGQSYAVPGGDDAATAILNDTRRQLEEYFDGERRQFEIPLNPSGSDFQMRVWRAISSIPYGEVLSYGDLAVAAGSPGAYRAAGSACGVNRITIIIPCHRVIAANRALGGYGGGNAIKKHLLHLEGSLAGLKGGQEALAFL